MNSYRANINLDTKLLCLFVRNVKLEKQTETFANSSFEKVNKNKVQNM